MEMINKLVRVLCPSFPCDRTVTETMDKERYYHIDLTTKTLYVPCTKVLRVNLVEIDRFAEAVHNFEKISDWTSTKYKWSNFDGVHLDEFQDIQEELASILQKVSEGFLEPYIAVDIESKNTGWDTNKLLCIGLAMRDIHGVEYTWSFIWDESWKDILTPFFTNKTLKRILHNGKFDKGRLKYLNNIDLTVDEDTMLMHYVGINERRGTHGLKILGPLYLQAPHWDDKLDVYKKNWCKSHGIKLGEFSYDMMPLNILIPYLHMDCLCTLRLFHLFKYLMRPNSFDIYRRLIEASNIYCVVELNGFYIDMDYMKELEALLKIDIEEATVRMNKAIESLWDSHTFMIESGARSLPKEFNMKSPKQLKWLIEKIVGHSIEGTDKDTLEEIANSMQQQEDSIGKEFIDAITLLRKKNKSLDTYVTGLQRNLCNDRRIRGTYNLHGTETGRLSSSEPNMQNIPRDKLIKNLFTAAPNKKLIQLDYSQAELRVLAYLSGDEWLTDVYVQGHDLHDRVAEQMFGPNFDKEQRVMAKTINFGIAYGRGANNIAEVFGLTVVEAQKLINNWFVPMPKVKEYLQNQKRKPFKNDIIDTVFGRQRSFIITADNKYNIQNEAMNMPIQSTASDCTLISLCQMHNWIVDSGLQDKVKIIATVHDSIILEADDIDELVSTVVTNCVNIMQTVPAEVLPNNKVPFAADAEVGYKWGELKKWKSEKIMVG